VAAAVHPVVHPGHGNGAADFFRLSTPAGEVTGRRPVRAKIPSYCDTPFDASTIYEVLLPSLRTRRAFGHLPAADPTLRTATITIFVPARSTGQYTVCPMRVVAVTGRGWTAAQNQDIWFFRVKPRDRGRSAFQRLGMIRSAARNGRHVPSGPCAGLAGGSAMRGSGLEPGEANGGACRSGEGQCRAKRENRRAGSGARRLPSDRYSRSWRGGPRTAS